MGFGIWNLRSGVRIPALLNVRGISIRNLMVMEVFIARQPIFDAHQKVFGYELFFRSGLDNLFMHPDPNQATSRVIADSFFLLSMSELTGGKRAFINVTREVLLKEYLYLVPKDLIVVEILETVAPDPEIIAACKKLKGAGYLLALDDFIYKEEYRALVELSDFIKVDVLSTDEEAQRSLAKEFAPRGIRLLAEKVETTHVHQGALKMGYTYFQGYFSVNRESSRGRTSRDTSSITSGSCGKYTGGRQI